MYFLLHNTSGRIWLSFLSKYLCAFCVEFYKQQWCQLIITTMVEYFIYINIYTHFKTKSNLASICLFTLLYFSPEIDSDRWILSFYLSFACGPGHTISLVMHKIRLMELTKLSKHFNIIHQFLMFSQLAFLTTEFEFPL